MLIYDPQWVNNFLILKFLRFGKYWSTTLSDSFPMFEQKSIVKEVILRQFFAMSNKDLSVIIGYWKRSSFSNRWYPQAISNKPLWPTKDTFNKERSLRVGKPRAIAARPVLVTTLQGFSPWVYNLPKPTWYGVPMEISTTPTSMASYQK